MQVDLYEPNILRRANRQHNQIATRGFTLDSKHIGFPGICNYFNKEDCEKYKQHLPKLLDNGRHYQRIGTALQDNLFELEALGLSNNGQKYTAIIDFSYALDYALYRLFSCDMQTIRNIQDYNLISSSIMNCDFSAVKNITFSRLIDASDELASFFIKQSKQAQLDEVSLEEQLSSVVFNFYSQVLSLISDLKFYTAVKVCEIIGNRYGRKGVVRSMSFSKVLITTDYNINEEIILNSLNKKFEEYKVLLRTFNTYEYTGEVQRYEFGREI